MTMRAFNDRTVIAAGLFMLLISGFSACSSTERRSFVRELPPDETRDAAVRSLADLEGGHPKSYYVQQFIRLGYSVDEVRNAGNRQVYDLRKGDERAMVGLAVPNAKSNVAVTQVDVQQYRAQNSDEQTATAIMNEFSKVHPGKKPYEYIPLVSKYGKVVEYSADRNDAKIEFQANNTDRYYRVNMSVDPQQQIVTRIDVDKNIWRAFR